MNNISSLGYVCSDCSKKYPTTPTLGFPQNPHLFQSSAPMPPHILAYVVPLPPSGDEEEDYDKEDEEDEEEFEREDHFDIYPDPTLPGADSGINGPPADWMEYEEHHKEEDYDGSDEAEIEMTEEEDEERRDRLTPNLVGELEKKDAVKSGEAMRVVDHTDVELSLKTAPVDLDLKLGF
ncbi:hypothetical protein M5689_015380 [Euphorbia peplus]|nr:hypothetical protein M5689_015380 [Euphorbia peplus]